MEENPRTLSQEGKALLLSGQYERALDVYTQALCLTPDDALLHHHQGYIFNALGRYQEALEAAGQAVSLQEQLLPAYCNRAYAALRLEQHDVAYANYMQVYFRLQGQTSAAAFDLEQTPINRTPVEDEAEEANSYPSRIAMLAYQAQGYVLTQFGLHAEAMAAFRQALRVAPQEAVNQQAMLHYDQGTALMRLKRAEEALAAFTQAREMAPNAAENSYGVGYALSDLDRHAEAVAAFDRALALDPQLAPAYNDRACSLQVLQRYAEALTSVEMAISLAPELVYPYETRGDILFALQRYEEALESFEQAAARDPKVVFKKAALLQKTLRALGQEG
ncbi:MAG TPA: tetratricopeptide repeat protein [Ktedonobacterales bacterium]|nr:tetratricopeptide repeat protein [Ktedonobacterales bacterium]